MKLNYDVIIAAVQKGSAMVRWEDRLADWLEEQGLRCFIALLFAPVAIVTGIFFGKPFLKALGL